MKKVLCVVGFLLWTTISVTAQTIKFKDIVGTWEISDEDNNVASLQIIDSTTIILTYMGETKKLTDYKIDLSKSPCWFDFSTMDSSSVVHVNVKSLLKKESDTVLKWQLFVDEERTPHFTSGKGETFYLRKTKQPASPSGSGTVAAASH